MIKKADLIHLMNKYNCESVKVVQNLDLEKAGNFNREFCFDVFGDKILRIQDVITKDNINLYYEFMSDEDLEQNSIILDSSFNDRLDCIQDIISYTPINYNAKVFKCDRKLYLLSISLFGVKDTLKPIDEYIEGIKASDAYKAYIASKS